MNQITEKQNKVENLELLAAQRYLYTFAKKLQQLEVFLCVPCLVVMAILSMHLDSDKAFLSIASAGVVFINILILDPWIERIKVSAAKIQNMFDCNVLDIPWNYLKLGAKPGKEIKAEYVAKYKKKEADFGSLKDWYSGKRSGSESAIASLVHQKSNVWWDSYLRKRFVVYRVIVDIAFFLFLLTICTITGCSLKTFILQVLIPFIPLFLLSNRLYRQHRQAFFKYKRTNDYLKEVFEKIQKGDYQREDVEIESILLQDEIYESRIASPLIPDWFYSFFRKRQENILRN